MIVLVWGTFIDLIKIILLWIAFIASTIIFAITALRVIVLFNNSDFIIMPELLWFALAIGAFIISGNYLWGWF